MKSWWPLLAERIRRRAWSFPAHQVDPIGRPIIVSITFVSRKRTKRPDRQNMMPGISAIASLYYSITKGLLHRGAVPTLQARLDWGFLIDFIDLQYLESQETKLGVNIYECSTSISCRLFDFHDVRSSTPTSFRKNEKFQLSTQT